MTTVDLDHVTKTYGNAAPSVDANDEEVPAPTTAVTPAMPRCIA